MTCCVTDINFIYLKCLTISYGTLVIKIIFTWQSTNTRIKKMLWKYWYHEYLVYIILSYFILNWKKCFNILRISTFFTHPLNMVIPFYILYRCYNYIHIFIYYFLSPSCFSRCSCIKHKNRTFMKILLSHCGYFSSFWGRLTCPFLPSSLPSHQITLQLHGLITYFAIFS